MAGNFVKITFLNYTNNKLTILGKKNEK